MKGVQKLAADVTAARKPAAADNPFLALQTQVSDQIVAALDAYRVARDQMAEQMFFGFYGSPFVQALLGLNADSEVRPFPGTSPEKLAARQAQADAYAAKLQTGGFDEALTRAVLYVTAADRMLDQRCALALNVARQQLMHLSLAEFKALVRDQFFVLQLERERAVEALASWCRRRTRGRSCCSRCTRSSARAIPRPPPSATAWPGCRRCWRRRLRSRSLPRRPAEPPQPVRPPGPPRCRAERDSSRHAVSIGRIAAMQTIVNKTFEEIAPRRRRVGAAHLAGRRRAGLGRRLRRCWPCSPAQARARGLPASSRPS